MKVCALKQDLVEVELVRGLVFTYNIHEWGFGPFFRWWSVGGQIHNIDLSFDLLCLRLSYFYFWPRS